MKKFDVIVGNPPYQNNKAQGQGPLWPKFMQRAIDLTTNDGHVGMIIPGRFVLPKAANKFWDKNLSHGSLLYVNVGECSRHFTVGRSSDYFGAFVLSKAKIQENMTVIKYPGETFKDNLEELNFMPRRGGYYAVQIIRKMQRVGHSNGFFAFQRGNRHLAKNQPKVGFGYYQHGSKYEKLIMFDFSGTAEFEKIHVNYTWCPLPTDATSEGVKSVFMSKLFRWFGNSMVDGDLSTSIQQQFPKLDLSYAWKDADIYEYLGLSTDEIDFIEQNLNENHKTKRRTSC